MFSMSNDFFMASQPAPSTARTSALSVAGSNCVLTASGLVMTRLRARAVANTLTRIASMYSTKLWGGLP